MLSQPTIIEASDLRLSFTIEVGWVLGLLFGGGWVSGLLFEGNRSFSKLC